MHHTVRTTGLAHGGHAIARIDEQVCFVDGALPDEKAAIRVDRKSKGVMWATALEILEPSPARLAVDTPLHGGNGWLVFAYPEQGEWKRRIVRDCMARIAKIDVAPGWIEDPSLRTGYRTRAEFHGDGTRFGFFARGSHDIVSIDRDAILHDRLNAVIPKLRAANLRGSVEVTVNPEGPEVLVWTAKPHPALAKAFLAYNHLHDKKPRAWFLFDGVPVVNGGFSQASLLLNRLLVAEVHRHAAGAKRVLDLYAGSGNLSLGLCGDAEVFGLDHNEAAIAAAQDQGKGTYKAGGEKLFIDYLARGPWDCVILDPPRQGAKDIIEVVAACTAKTIVYVACDPAALARDTAALLAAGRTLESVTAIDLFPNTPHMEALAVFR